jgi:autotransporter-associated beta strand protein
MFKRQTLALTAVVGMLLMGIVQPVMGVTAEWVISPQGLWSTTPNWDVGIMPNGTYDVAVFGLQGDGLVIVDMNVTVGRMTFDNSQPYTISGTSQITLDGGGNALIDVLSGSHTIAVPLANPHFTMIDTAFGAHLAVSSTISGAGSLVKIGGGSACLTGFSTYIGGTSVQAGTLFVEGSIVSPTTVMAGGTLSGTGYINAPVTVTPNGSLSPGHCPNGSIGTIHTGDLTLMKDAQYRVEIDGASADCTSVTGMVALETPMGNSLLDLALVGAPPQPNHVYPIILNDGSDPIGNQQFKLFGGGLLQEGVPFPVGGAMFTIDYHYNFDGGPLGNDVVLNAVPEPSTLILFSMGIIGLSAFVWRQRKRDLSK